MLFAGVEKTKVDFVGSVRVRKFGFRALRLMTEAAVPVYLTSITVETSL